MTIRNKQQGGSGDFSPMSFADKVGSFGLSVKIKSLELELVNIKRLSVVFEFMIESKFKAAKDYLLKVLSR